MKQGNARLTTTRRISGLVLVVCALVSPLGLAEVYKWTDENGVTHYSETPPPAEYQTEAQEIDGLDVDIDQQMPANDGPDGSDAAGTELSAADQVRQELAEAREAKADERAAKEALCSDTQQRLAQLEPSRRVFYTNDEGETVRMDDEERVAEVERLRNIQSNDCQ